MRENKILIEKMKEIVRKRGKLNPERIIEVEHKKPRPPSSESLNRGLRLRVLRKITDDNQVIIISETFIECVKTFINSKDCISFTTNRIIL